MTSSNTVQFGLYAIHMPLDAKNHNCLYRKGGNEKWQAYIQLILIPNLGSYLPVPKSTFAPHSPFCPSPLIFDTREIQSE